MCSTSEIIDEFLSKYECDSICPTISEILQDNRVILQYHGNKFTYDYISGNIVNE